jgi:hypothetical protein
MTFAEGGFGVAKWRHRPLIFFKCGCFKCLGIMKLGRRPTTFLNIGGKKLFHCLLIGSKTINFTFIYAIHCPRSESGWKKTERASSLQRAFIYFSRSWTLTDISLEESAALLRIAPPYRRESAAGPLERELPHKQHNFLPGAKNMCYFYSFF